MKRHIRVQTNTKAGSWWDSTKSWMGDTKEKAGSWWGTASEKANAAWKSTNETWDKYF